MAIDIAEKIRQRQEQIRKMSPSVSDIFMKMVQTESRLEVPEDKHAEFKNKKRFLDSNKKPIMEMENKK